MNATENDQIKGELSALIQSPEFAETIGNAIVARLLPGPATNTDHDSTLRATLPLLREYTSKLQEYAPKTGFWAWSRNTGRNPSLEKILPTAKKLAQFVSQRLDGAQDDLLRLELELRLVEYEAALSTAQKRTG
jgi:hypothetical protein